MPSKNHLGTLFENLILKKILLQQFKSTLLHYKLTQVRFQFPQPTCLNETWAQINANRINI